MDPKPEYEPQTFVKKQHNGPDLTRVVTNVSGEVEAKFDGFHPKAASKSSGGTSRSSSASSSSS